MTKQILVFIIPFLIMQNRIKSMENVEEELSDRPSRYTNFEIKQENKSAEPLKLVPDDIVSPSRWEEYPPKSPSDFGMQTAIIQLCPNAPASDFNPLKRDPQKLPEFEIRKRHRYIPALKTSTSEITMTVVHGTWGRFSEFC